MNIFVTILTLAAVFNSSEGGPQGRIIYGQIAGERQFPFNVGIAQYSGGGAVLICGGAIISHNWVITAGHCVENLTEATLHLGSTNFFTPNLTLTLPADCFYMHPNYNTSNLANDIALINMPHIAYTDKINAVRLPSMRDDVDIANEYVVAMGWGEDETGTHSLDNLKFARMRVMRHARCQAYFSYVLDRRLLCAFAAVSSNCYGDSGGPLVMSSNNLLVGIFSFVAAPSCSLRNPVGFVRVTEYLDWIESVSGVSSA